MTVRTTLPTTIALLLIWIIGVVAAQDPALPPDALRGTVVRADTRGPLPRVRLELVPEEYAKRPTGYEKVCKPYPDIEPTRLRRTAFADDSGRFTFMDVEPGRYLLAAEHEGYLRAEWGQRGRFPIGTVLTVGVQQDPTSAVGMESMSRFVLQNLTIALHPAPTISGRVFDDASRSVTAGIIQAYHGIAPGEYKLFAWQFVEQNAYFNADFIGFTRGCRLSPSSRTCRKTPGHEPGDYKVRSLTSTPPTSS